MEYTHLSQINIKENLNSRVYGVFVADEVEVRPQKNGGNYINLTMRDKDVKINAKKFGASEEDVQTLVSGKVYCAAIDVKPYKDEPSCVIYNFEEIDEDPRDFVNVADGMEHAYQIISKSLESIKGSIYYSIVAHLLIDNWSKFTQWTAANSMHHDMIGGLFVHTAEVVEQSEVMGKYWQERYGESFINMPLLIAGALVHDIGKLKELDVNLTTGSTQYSTQASLETHISIGISMIDIEAYKQGFGLAADGKSDEQLKSEVEALSLLRHLVLSHHGKKEFGSPISPNTPEAYILSQADLMSAEMYRFNKTLNQMDAGTSNAVWLSGNMVNTYKDSGKMNSK